MMDALIAGIIGLLTGAVGSLVAPWANWMFEQRRLKLVARKDQIAKWRDMFVDVSEQYGNKPSEDDSTLPEMLERHKDYYSLKSQLDYNAIHVVKRRDIQEAKGITLVQHGQSIRINPPDPIIRYLAEDIASLERKWDLI